MIDLLAPSGTEEEVTGEMKANGIEFMFTAGSAAGKTLGWRILAWRVKGPARLVGIGTGETGTQAVVTYPHNGLTATNKFWIDNLVVTWSNWPKGIEATDIGNSNSVASVWMDDDGYRYWKIEITDADGVSGTEAGNVAAWWGLW